MRTVLLAAVAGILVGAPKPGPGVVWVNTDTNTYHCYGTQFYGNTKKGTYMDEKEAQASGNKPAGGQICSAPRSPRQAS
jgi:hypothetical protein